MTAAQILVMTLSLHISMSIQVQAGLLFVDAANVTMRETFFRPWADCANNDDCLIPDDIQIKKGFQLPFLKNYSIEGQRVFRCVTQPLRE